MRLCTFLQNLNFILNKNLGNSLRISPCICFANLHTRHTRDMEQHHIYIDRAVILHFLYTIQIFAGQNLSNTLLTKIWVGRFDLNLLKFSVGFADKPECICQAKEESSLHYMLDRFLYTAERRTLFSLVKHLIPFFPRMNRKSKLYLLFNGLKIDDPDYNHLNYIIICAVQTYIIHTKRFLHHLLLPLNPTLNW